MGRSFGAVENKVREASYFLERLHPDRFDFVEANFYLSAFSSAARSITFAIQACISDVPGFPDWWTKKQDAMRSNPVAKYFLELRNLGEKRGVTVINSFMLYDHRITEGNKFSTDYWLGSPDSDLPPAPEGHVYDVCRTHFVTLLDVVYDCYTDFGGFIDPQLHYTQAHYEAFGQTIEDAEVSMGLPRGWTQVEGTPEELPHRFAALRRHAGVADGEEVFEEYLGKQLPKPEEPPPCKGRLKESGSCSDE